MLRACNKVLRSQGRIAFVTISIVPGLSEKAHRRAARIGPRSVTSDRSSEQLLTDSGFTEVEIVDVTEDFERTAQAWKRHYSEYEAELRRLIGDEQFEDLNKNRTDLITGVEEGLLERTLAVGVKP